MLTVQQVIPDAPAAGNLEPGDILLRINGELVTEFILLAEILDNSVNTDIEVEVERGGQSVSATIAVTDLHAITPDEFLEFGDAIVNNLSYQQARHYNRAVSGVYVANPGYLLSKSAIPRGAVITEFGGKTIENIDDFANALDQLADGSRSLTRFTTMDSPQNSSVRTFEMDRVWFPVRRCARNDHTGVWPCQAQHDKAIGRAGHCHDQSKPRGLCGRRRVPRGSLLSLERAACIRAGCTPRSASPRKR